MLSLVSVVRGLPPPSEEVVVVWALAHQAFRWLSVSSRHWITTVQILSLGPACMLVALKLICGQSNVRREER